MAELPPNWQISKLGECVIGGPEYGANSPSINFDKNLPRYVRITDINDSGQLRPDGHVGVQLEGNEKYVLFDGDFLFARSGATVGKTYLYSSTDGWAIYAGYLIRFRPDPKKLLPIYLKNFTETLLYKNWVKSTLRAGAQPNINAQEFSSLPIILPPLPEQRKIAAILSTWDEAIALTERLIAALKERKKGLMQRLLTGEVRFPGFEGAWQTVNFSDVLNIQIGRTPSRNEPSYWDSNKYSNNVWLSIADLKEKYVSDSKEYISDKGVQKFQIPIVPKGTVIMSFKLTIGRAAIAAKDIYTNEAICALIPKKDEEILNRFLYHALSIVRFDKEIDQAVKGRTLNIEKIRRLGLLLPSYDEQTKIADTLDIFDEEIILQQKYLALLHQQKKGLMQQLLTGKIRVAM